MRTGKQYHIYISDETRRQLKTIAAVRGCTISQALSGMIGAAFTQAIGDINSQLVANDDAASPSESPFQA